MTDFEYNLAMIINTTEEKQNNLDHNTEYPIKNAWSFFVQQAADL